MEGGLISVIGVALIREKLYRGCKVCKRMNLSVKRERTMVSLETLESILKRQKRILLTDMAIRTYHIIIL
jgi:hypothetical protein